MAITINWQTQVIFVPRADMTLIQLTPTEIRELDLNAFRLRLKDLEDDEAGMSFPYTHNHFAPVSVGGVTLAMVIEIVNGYTVTFEDGQYAVNLVGANSNVGDVTNVNQVSVRSSNSAGLVQSSEIEQISYNGGVTIDPASTNMGTLFPIGTEVKPVNNINDALLIASVRGLTKLFIKSDLDLSASSADLSNLTITSTGAASITLGPSVLTNGASFEDLELHGTFSGPSVEIRGCEIFDITVVVGDSDIKDSELYGTITPQGSGQILLANCYDALSPVSSPVVDLAGFSGTLLFRKYAGALSIRNCTAACTGTYDTQGRVTLESTVVAGSFLIRGIGHVVDNSSGSATVDTSDLITNQSIANKTITDPHTLTVGKFLGLK